MKNKTIVLTGSTGALGKLLADELLKHDNILLVLLVRAASSEEARARVQKIIDVGGEKVEVFRSDLTLDHLGLSESDYTNLARRTTHILHSAASVRFTNPIEEARLHNVKTTEQMITFAKSCPNLLRFGFVSSALVSGNRSGLIMEDDFEHKSGFKNTYEQTKYEAETLVRASDKVLPIVIFRPPLIITSTSTKGSKERSDYLTLLISLVARGLLPFVPGTKNSPLDIVDGDDVAGIIVNLLLKDRLAHTTYHITNGSSAFAVELFHHMIEEKLGKKIPIEYCGDMESFTRRLNEEVRRNPEIQIAYRRAESFLPEPAYPKIFDNRNTLSELNILRIGEDPLNILHSVLYDVL